jgi:class 3 adenylate cyclase/tetratricopeptide (TPR) repeat protein
MGGPERRLITVLFCDVVDSTPLSRRHDPEDVCRLMRAFHAVCQQAVDEAGGITSAPQGDGMLAYFGFPSAGEDDAVRAVGAALRVVSDVERIVNEHGVGRALAERIRVRVGLHTGTTAIESSGPYPIAYGDSVNLAARIQSLAADNTVLLSPATARLVEGHFELEAQPEAHLKGFEQPMILHRVCGATGARSSFEAATRRKLTPHVGREEELEALTQIWREVRAGADRVVVVRGEPGIGKSRTLYQLRRRVEREGGAVLECLCSPLTQSTALAAIVELLSRRLAERARRDALEPLTALRALVTEARLADEALPLFGLLLSIAVPDELAALLRELSPARRRSRTLDLLRDWFAAMAALTPLALIVEDLHWADPSTLDFLDLLVARGPGRCTLLCVSARPDFPERWSEHGVVTIELGRLGVRESAALVANVAGARALASQLVERIVERSEGVPLFLEEITKVVLDAGDEQVLPTTLEGSLVARFDRLADGRGVAQLGAAIGREFSHRLLQAVAGLDDQALAARLECLCKSELTFVRGEPPAAIYRFKHALIQDAIYGTLPKSERARVHARIFDTLREQFPDDFAAQPELGAFHAKAAGLDAAAVPLLRDAGLKALARTALVEAVTHLSEAIARVHLLDPRLRPRMEIELQAAIGPAYMATMGWAAAEVERSSARLRELCRAERDDAGLQLASWSLWTVDFLRARLDAALSGAREVLGMARASADPLLLVTGHHAVGYTHFFRGEYDQALSHARLGLGLFELEREGRIAATYQLSSSCAMWCYQAESLQLMGLTDQADRSMAAVVRLVDELGHAPSTAYVLGMQCFFFHARGAVAVVARHAEALRALALAEGFVLWIAVADVFLGWVSARRGGDPREALASVRAARSRYEATLAYVTAPQLTCAFAEVLILAGRARDVGPIIDSVLAVTRPGGVRHYESELLRLQGDAARAQGDRERAADCYEQALASARALGASLLEARVTRLLEELFH